MSTSHPIPAHSTFFVVFAALLVGTGLTVLVAKYDLDAMFHVTWLNTAIALTIAIIKATLVIVYFMGVRWNTPLTKIVVLAGFFWLFILFGLTMNDYLTRGWLGVLGR
jgi:cytochrome c oxidase subunit IV